MLNCSPQEMLIYVKHLLEDYTVEDNDETTTNDHLALDTIANILRMWNTAEG